MHRPKFKMICGLMFILLALLFMPTWSMADTCPKEYFEELNTQIKEHINKGHYDSVIIGIQHLYTLEDACKLDTSYSISLAIIAIEITNKIGLLKDSYTEDESRWLNIADTCFRKAFLLFERQPYLDKIVLDKFLIEYANYCRSIKEYEKSLSYFNTSLQIRKNIYGENHKKTAIANRNLGMPYYNQNKFATALPSFHRAWNYFNKDSLISDETYSRLVINLGRSYASMAIEDSSIYYFEHWLKPVELNYGKNSPEYLNRMCDIAGQLWNCGLIDAAKHYYNKTLPLRENLFGFHSENIVCGLVGVIDTMQKTTYNLEYLYNYLFRVPLHSESYTYLDSMAEISISQKNYYDELYYSLLRKDAAFREFPLSNNKVPFSLQRLGRGALEWDLPMAVVCMEEALMIIAQTEGDTSSNYADALWDYSGLYSLHQNFITAAGYLKMSLIACEKSDGKLSSKYIRTLKEFADIEGRCCDFSKALETFDEALKLSAKFKGEESLLFNEVLRAKGGMLLFNAKLDEAKELFLKVAQKLEDSVGVFSPDYVYIANSLYHVSVYKGVISDQIFWKDKTLKYHAQFNHGSFKHINDIMEYGSILTDVGNYEDALKQIENAYTLIQKSTSKTQLLDSYYWHMIKFCLATGRTKESADYSLKRIASMESSFSSSKTYDVINLRNEYQTLGDIYLQLGEIKHARAACLRAYNLGRILNNTESANDGNIYRTLGNCYLLEDNLDSALYCFQRNSDLQNSTYSHDHISKAEAMSDLATFYWRVGNFSKAESLLRQSCASINKHMLDNFTGLSEENKVAYTAKRIRFMQQYYSLVNQVFSTWPESIRNAYQFALNSKGVTLKSDMAINHFIATSDDTVLQGYYSSLLNTKRLLYHSFDIMPEHVSAQKHKPDSLLKVSNDLEMLISFRSKEFLNLFKEKETVFNDVRDVLADDEVAIEFVSYPYFNGISWTDSVYYGAFIVSNADTIPKYVFIAEEREITQIAHNVGNARGLKLVGDSTIGNNTAELYNLVWRPMEHHLKGKKRIYLTADGTLNKISFLGLSDSSSNYLGEKYEFHYLLSNRDIVKIKSVENNVSDVHLALYGGIVYDVYPENNSEPPTEIQQQLFVKRSLPEDLRGNEKWDYLVGTKKEVDDIYSILKKHSEWRIESFSDTMASEDRIKRMTNVHAPKILHIATHGFYFPKDVSRQSTFISSRKFKNSDNPLMRSGIILAGGNAAWLGKALRSQSEDGVLTAYEISTLNLTHTELVVLSACETGVGEVNNGEGVFGIQRALRQAGVDKMILSLWKVPDRETSEMMICFYQNLITTKNYSNAFRTAQKQMMEKYRNNPELWAGFVLVE